MTMTDELRRLLDERGVKWWNASPCKTKWNSPVLGGPVAVSEWNGDMVLDAGYVSVTPEQAIAATVGPRITGETSDGYHTFNELYHHRAVLFSVIVCDHNELAWKSKLHHDGTMYEGMFIVGIDTPKGQATYHYDVDPYWDMFDCRELERAPEWDGHTPDDAIERIATLGNGECELEPIPAIVVTMNMLNEIADPIQALANLAHMYAIDLSAALERCTRRNRERGRLQHHTQGKEASRGQEHESHARSH